MRQYHNAPLALAQTLLEIEERAIYYTKRSRGADGTLPPELEASVLERFRNSFDRVEKLLAHEALVAINLQGVLEHSQAGYREQRYEIDALQGRVHDLEHRVEELQARIAELESTNTL